uniref:Uncharacterized protein n=1 Tax=Oryza brachyantha TaxID=4533 RepID=J3N951_ORYBR
MLNLLQLLLLFVPAASVATAHPLRHSAEQIAGAAHGLALAAQPPLCLLDRTPAASPPQPNATSRATGLHAHKDNKKVRLSANESARYSREIDRGNALAPSRK